MTIYRYKYKGLDQQILRDIGEEYLIKRLNTPIGEIDIELSDDNQKPDLDLVMQRFGYEFSVQDPTDQIKVGFVSPTGAIWDLAPDDDGNFWKISPAGSPAACRRGAGCHG